MSGWKGHGKRLAARGGLALLILLGGSGCEYTMQPLKGQDGRTLVYAAVGKEGAPNAGVVLTRIGAVVIDPPLTPELGDRLNTDALRRSKTFWDELHRRLKHRPRTLAPPVLYVFNTTYRASHTFGNQSFSDIADIIATDKAAKHLGNVDDVRRMREILKERFKVPGLERHAMVVPSITFEGSMTLKTPDAEIKIISMGDCVGEGDAVVYLPQQRILFAGDLVIPGFVPYYEGRTLTVRHWIAQLRKLQKMKIDVVVPGHGAVGGKELIKKQLQFLAVLVAEVQRAVAAGKSVEETQRQVRLTNFARWRNYGKWLGENIRLVHKELSQPKTVRTPPPPASGAAMAAPRKMEGPDPYRDH